MPDRDFPKRDRAELSAVAAELSAVFGLPAQAREISAATGEVWRAARWRWRGGSSGSAGRSTAASRPRAVGARRAAGRVPARLLASGRRRHRRARRAGAARRAARARERPAVPADRAGAPRGELLDHRARCSGTDSTAAFLRRIAIRTSSSGGSTTRRPAGRRRPISPGGARAGGDHHQRRPGPRRGPRGAHPAQNSAPIGSQVCSRRCSITSTRFAQETLGSAITRPREIMVAAAGDDRDGGRAPGAVTATLSLRDLRPVAKLGLARCHRA